MMERMDDLPDPFGEPELTKIAVLGSTGSVGRQALEVVRANPRFRIVGLSAGSDAETLLTQAKEFDVEMLALARGHIEPTEGVEVFLGPESAALLAEASDAHVVLNAVVGSAGLQATMATIRSGKTLALANKESLVSAGEAVMAKSGPGQIRPVDSEHSALWQLLEGVPADHVRRVLLTGSGGPFRGRDSAFLDSVTVAQALAHPVWEMGKKITIDSATMMNKGLEVIEAHFLFGFTYDEIDVVLNPEGVVHGIVELRDGTSLMHAAVPDMRLPIQIALSGSDRINSGWGRTQWSSAQISFEAPDRETFPCLDLAYDAGRRGDTYPAVLNASNEVAVAAFLEGKLKFAHIPTVVASVLESHDPIPPDIDNVLSQDEWARRRAQEVIDSL